MDENKRYKWFKLVFPLIILVFAICLIIAGIAAWNDTGKVPIYLILGIVFIAESIFGLYETCKHKSGSEKTPE
ncbi:hypothetical protein JSQ81_14530 [Sporosarcina sp. Marseille-Q4063]|uniref:hypothetical protein n=1 Tax=Sporosarcina sp. Marseille-Q4063 TaxID=2810514 RepID=UPI001BAF81C9|nr:hypothetical protein [Sporosarcina sp. Marseille-Q4063]QUW21022.1 hypothetical protein JSQ81_14530 [Sporosarcina sp. Marseille-Q4063]